MDHSTPTIIVISASSEAPGVVSLKSAALRLGYDFVTIAPDAEKAKGIINDAQNVIYRIGPKSYDKYTFLLSSLSGRSHEELGKVIRAFDKINTYNILARSNVPIPESWIVKRGQTYEDMPFVLKIARGNQGRGVELIRSQRDLDDYFVAFSDSDEFLAQEFIAEAKSCDKRLFVVGDKVVAAMERRSTSDDFRANLHLGGEGISYKPTSEEVRIALLSIEAFGLEYGGVDIIDGVNGPLVLEVNPSPGFGISAVTGVDVATELIKYIVGVKND